MEKEEAFQGTCELFEDREKVYNGFYKEIFPLLSIGTAVSAQLAKNKVFDRLYIKILTHKQMLQRLPVVLTQVKLDNTSKNLLMKIRQIIYSLNRARKL